MKKVIDDHIMMIRNGEKKATPITQIVHWRKKNIFQKVGWKFIDAEKGEAAYQTFLAYLNDRSSSREMAQETITRDPGVAGAHEARVVTQDPGAPPPEVLGKSGDAEDLTPETSIPSVEIHDVLEDKDEGGAE